MLLSTDSVKYCDRLLSVNARDGPCNFETIFSFHLFRMPVSKCLFEVCVDSLESARNADKGGADRLELCSSLSLGGLTPTVGLVRAVKAHINIPAFAMIRPRDGDFAYDEDELVVMEEDIRALRECGVDGFVFGVLKPDGSLDQDACLRLLKLAEPLPCTFHR